MTPADMLNRLADALAHLGLNTEPAERDGRPALHIWPPDAPAAAVDVAYTPACGFISEWGNGIGTTPDDAAAHTAYLYGLPTARP